MTNTNALPDIRPLCLWNKGENYIFDGALRVLMERVEPSNPLFVTKTQTFPAIDVGVWPLPEGAHDPALDGLGIPDGAHIYGCFGEHYERRYAPDAIPGLVKAGSPSELTGDAYCVLATGSEYVYVITMTDKPVDIVAADYDTNPLFNFYAGLSGDAVQTYARGIDRSFNQHDIALSSLWDGKELCDYVFGELGYNCEYATASEIKADKAKYIDKLKSYIDRGIPVLQRWVPGSCTLDQVGCDKYRAKYGAYLAEKQASCYSLIVGYEDGGNTILYIDGGIDIEPIRYTTELDVCWDWVFIGGKQREIELSELYKNAMKRTLELLTSPDKYGSSFGAKAFRDWADDVERGVFADDRGDTKSEYTTYICVLATNGSAHGHIFSNIATDFPEWKFVSDIIERYKALGGDDSAHLSGVWQDLEELGGGFNFTPEVMQDIERRGKIAEKLREAAAHMDEVVRILLDNIHTTHYNKTCEV